MAITYGEVAAVKITDTPWSERTASGYGRKVPTRYKVQLTGDPLWRRVYCMIYSNSGSIYVLVKGEEIFLNELDIAVLLEGATA